MTPQEAIKIFKTVVVYAPEKHENKYYKAIMLAIEALEKQIPKNPLNNYGGGYRCPNCQMKHLNPDWVGVKHCDCGQALDLSNN